MTKRERLIELIKDSWCCRDTCKGCDYEWDDDCNTQKTVDYLLSNGVEPVKHGRWDVRIDPTTGRFANCKCSLCRATAWGVWNYCPNCGAKMDAEVE